jgi:hypothetical protein
MALLMFVGPLATPEQLCVDSAGWVGRTAFIRASITSTTVHPGIRIGDKAPAPAD